MLLHSHDYPGRERSPNSTYLSAINGSKQSASSEAAYRLANRVAVLVKLCLCQAKSITDRSHPACQHDTSNSGQPSQASQIATPFKFKLKERTCIARSWICAGPHSNVFVHTRQMCNQRVDAEARSKCGVRCLRAKVPRVSFTLHPTTQSSHKAHMQPASRLSRRIDLRCAVPPWDV
jgi:hypothetical protein